MIVIRSKYNLSVVLTLQTIFQILKRYCKREIYTTRFNDQFIRIGFQAKKETRKCFANNKSHSYQHKLQRIDNKYILNVIILKRNQVDICFGG